MTQKCAARTRSDVSSLRKLHARKLIGKKFERLAQTWLVLATEFEAAKVLLEKWGSGPVTFSDEAVASAQSISSKVYPAARQAATHPLNRPMPKPSDDLSDAKLHLGLATGEYEGRDALVAQEILRRRLRGTCSQWRLPARIYRSLDRGLLALDQSETYAEEN